MILTIRDDLDWSKMYRHAKYLGRQSKPIVCIHWYWHTCIQNDTPEWQLYCIRKVVNKDAKNKSDWNARQKQCYYHEAKTVEYLSAMFWHC